jgi:hypothetical protein
MKTMYEVWSTRPECGRYGIYETLEEAKRQCGEEQVILKVEAPR